MICSDGGGSNGSRNKVWKIHLQELANQIKIPMTICHYPPGTSKWNKIEHCMFSFISKNWKGQPLVTIENGKKNITISQLERLAQALGVSVDKLLKWNYQEIKSKVIYDLIMYLWSAIARNSWVWKFTCSINISVKIKYNYAENALLNRYIRPKRASLEHPVGRQNVPWVGKYHWPRNLHGWRDERRQWSAVYLLRKRVRRNEFCRQACPKLICPTQAQHRYAGRRKTRTWKGVDWWRGKLLINGEERDYHLDCYIRCSTRIGRNI